MRPHLVLRMLIYTTLTVVSAGFLMAQDLPSYMAPISGRTVSSPAETAMKNVLALNTSMFELYDNAHKVFESNILSKHPVILGLFSGAGGRFFLYRPGMAPLEASSVPIGRRPTRPATRSMRRVKTTCYSACWRSFLGRKP